MKSKLESFVSKDYDTSNILVDPPRNKIISASTKISEMFYICIQRVKYLIFQDIPGYTPGEDDYEFFNSPWLSLVKTSTMFVGEIEFSDVPIGKNIFVFYMRINFNIFYLSFATFYMIYFQPFVNKSMYTIHKYNISFVYKTKKLYIFDDFDSIIKQFQKSKIC